jgi:hypothetical protein
MRHNLFVVSVLSAGAVAAVAMAGCGASDDLPRLPISGRVTYDGEPLTKAWIQFRPEGNGGVTASGAMIEDGAYSIPRGDGLIPGNYRVAITKAEEPEGDANKPEVASAPKESTKTLKLKKGMSPFGFAKQLIPDKYNTKTRLTANVLADGPTAFDFTLNSK